MVGVPWGTTDGNGSFPCDPQLGLHLPVHKSRLAIAVLTPVLTAAAAEAALDCLNGSNWCFGCQPIKTNTLVHPDQLGVHCFSLPKEFSMIQYSLPEDSSSPQPQRLSEFSAPLDSPRGHLRTASLSTEPITLTACSCRCRSRSSLRWGLRCWSCLPWGSTPLHSINSKHGHLIMR